MWQDNWRVKLDNCRERIDEIDRKIIESIEERMNVSKKIAEIKAMNNLPIYVHSRESLVIISRQEIGKKHGLSEQFVKELFLLLMKESKSKQKKIMEFLQMARL